jgi:trk/ktr system potassium uptake protein
MIDMRVAVLGCGRTGAGLATALALRGETVAVVDLDPGAFDRLGSGFAGQKIAGDALDRAVLEEVQIDRCDALAAVTGSDEANAVAGRLAAHRFHVPRVVARLYDPGKAALYRRLGIQTVSQVEWGIERIVELITSSDIAASTTLGGGQVDIVDVIVPAALEGRRLGEIEVPAEIRVVALTRSGRTFLADAPVRFERGDIAHLAVAAGAHDRLETLLQR